MLKLIMVSKDPNLEAGTVHRGLARGPWYEPEPNQCFRVVGRSTEESWINCLVSYGEERAYLKMIAEINGPWYYYEIQTD